MYISLYILVLDKIIPLGTIHFVFSRYFLVVACYSVDTYCENFKYPENPSEVLKVEIILSVLKLTYLSEHITDSSKLGLRN